MTIFIDAQNCKNLRSAGDITDYVLAKYQEFLYLRSVTCSKEALKWGVTIPIEDFYSNFNLALWNAIKDCLCTTHSDFIHVLRHRLKFAEANVWRSYANVGSSRDKGHRQYLAAKWVELSDPLIQEIEIQHDSNKRFLNLQLEEFYAQCSHQDQLLIRLLAEQFSPEEIRRRYFPNVKAATLRKHIQRLRQQLTQYVDR